MGETILRDKKNYANILKNHYFPTSKNKIHALITLSDQKIIDSFIEGLKILPVNFVILSDTLELNAENIVCVKSPKQDLLSGFDCILADGNFEGLNTYFTQGITPIVPENHYLKSILSEFEPIDGVGNSFFYQENNVWSMYYALIRYVENYKFPYDNRNLVKNVLAL